MSEQYKSKGPELLHDLAQHTSAALQELIELDKPKADHVGNALANRMASHWGGQLVYFPVGMASKLSARDLSVWHEFNGRNHSELARKYGVSLQWVYKIVKAMRQREQERSQKERFPSDAN